MKFALNKKTIIIIIVAIAILVPSIVLPIVLTQPKVEIDNVTVTYISEDLEYYKITIIKDQALTLTAPLPTREGFIFKGWFLDEGEWTIVFDPELPISEDTTVYAWWQAEDEDDTPTISYTVTVIGGFLHTGEPASVFITGTQATITAIVPEGQRFVHWTLAGTDTLFTDNPHSFGVNATMHFTAVFESLTGYFEVEVNGGTIRNSGSVGSFAGGANVTVEATIPDGKSFVCWEAGEEEIYQNPYTFTLISDMIFTAVFEDKVEESDRGLQYTFDESSGTYFVTSFVDSGELFLTIPEYHDNGVNGRREVTKINQNVFENTSLNSMIIPHTVTYIGERAFAGCLRLDAVYIHDSVNYMGNNVFLGCGNLTIYTEKTEKGDNWQLNWNGDVGRIEWGVVGTGIKDNIRYVKTTAIAATIIKYMGELQTLTLPHSVEEGVVLTKIAPRAFLDKAELKRVNMQAGISMISDEAFSGCNKLLTVMVTKTSPPVLGNNVFATAGGGLRIYVPDISHSDYKAAAGWNAYQNIIYSSAIITNNFAVHEGELIQYLGVAREVVIPSGINKISLFAFVGHADIERLVLSIEVEEIEGLPFAYLAPDFEGVDVTAGNPYFTMENGILYNADKSKLVWYPFSKADTLFTVPDTVTEIADYAFLGAKIETMYMRNITRIGQFAFLGCTALTGVHFDSSEPPQVASNSFDEMSSITIYAPSGSLAAYTAVFAGFTVVEQD